MKTYNKYLSIIIVPIMTRKFCLLMGILSLPVLQALGQNEWMLRKDKDGIKVYSSTVPDSKIQANRPASNLDIPEPCTTWFRDHKQLIP
jgi:hypothetical protein